MSFFFPQQAVNNYKRELGGTISQKKGSAPSTSQSLTLIPSPALTPPSTLTQSQPLWPHQPIKSQQVVLIVKQHYVCYFVFWNHERTANFWSTAVKKTWKICLCIFSVVNVWNVIVFRISSCIAPRLQTHRHPLRSMRLLQLLQAPLLPPTHPAGPRRLSSSTRRSLSEFNLRGMLCWRPGLKKANSPQVPRLQNWTEIPLCSFLKNCFCGPKIWDLGT